jgi:hypothetical protein
VAPFSETYLKPHERFYIPNYNFNRIDRHPGTKDGTAVAVRNGITHNHVDLPPLISIDATGGCNLLVTRKFCLQLFTNLQAVPGAMQTSLTS